MAQFLIWGAAEATQAVEAAYTALQSWKALTAQNRADILLAWHKLVLDHTDELALIMTIEQGKPLAEAKARFAMLHHLFNGLPKKASVFMVM